MQGWEHGKGLNLFEANISPNKISFPQGQGYIRVEKGFSVARDGSQNISVMRDRAV